MDLCQTSFFLSSKYHVTCFSSCEAFISATVCLICLHFGFLERFFYHLYIPLFFFISSCHHIIHVISDHFNIPFSPFMLFFLSISLSLVPSPFLLLFSFLLFFSFFSFSSSFQIIRSWASHQLLHLVYFN